MVPDQDKYFLIYYDYWGEGLSMFVQVHVEAKEMGFIN